MGRSPAVTLEYIIRSAACVAKTRVMSILTRIQRNMHLIDSKLIAIQSYHNYS
jgi:hypothetical protein